MYCKIVRVRLISNALFFGNLSWFLNTELKQTCTLFDTKLINCELKQNTFKQTSFSQASFEKWWYWSERESSTNVLWKLYGKSDADYLFKSCKSLHNRKPFVLAMSSNYRMHSRHHCLLIAINKDKALTFWKSIETNNNNDTYTNHNDLLRSTSKLNIYSQFIMKSIVMVMK